MKKSYAVFVLFLFCTLTSNGQATYRATHIIKKIEGNWGASNPDHSLITVDSKKLIVEIKDEKTNDHYYLFGTSSKITYDDGEEAIVYQCNDKNSIKCKFVLRGKDQPIFEIRYDDQVICYFANMIDPGK